MLTGATGFVGHHTLIALVQAGHDVHALTRRRGSDLPGVTWHECDLLVGCEVVDDVKPEVLVHLAWYAEHGKFWSSAENVRWVQASLALLRAFAAAGGRRAVMAGTCAEYEWGGEQDFNERDSPLAPQMLYGVCKDALRRIAGAYADETGLELAWGRLFFLYGPQEAPERFVPSLVRSLLAGEPALMTNGEQRRDFLHVADAGAAFVALAESQVVGPVNVASGKAVVLRELAQRIAQRVGGGELLQIGARPMPEGEPPALVADIKRLRDEVGWSPEIGLEDGLDSVIEWWRGQPDSGGP